MLRDLVQGYETHEVAESSGLRSLVQPAVAAVYQPTAATRMSLPAAMNALQRGEIARPADGDLNGMVIDAELPPKPAPAPTPDWRDDPIFVEARQQAAINHAEMRMRIAAKRGISVEAAQAWMEAESAR